MRAGQVRALLCSSVSVDYDPRESQSERTSARPCTRVGTPEATMSSSSSPSAPSLLPGARPRGLVVPSPGRAPTRRRVARASGRAGARCHAPGRLALLVSSARPYLYVGLEWCGWCTASASVGADHGALWWGSSTPFVASVLPPQIVTLPLGQPRPHPSLSSPSLLVPSQLLFEPRSRTPQ